MVSHKHKSQKIKRIYKFVLLSLLSRPLTEIPNVSFVADIFSHEQTDFFIGPESDHCLPLSVTHWLTDSLTTLLKSDLIDSYAC